MGKQFSYLDPGRASVWLAPYMNSRAVSTLVPLRSMWTGVSPVPALLCQDFLLLPFLIFSLLLSKSSSILQISSLHQSHPSSAPVLIFLCELISQGIILLYFEMHRRICRNLIEILHLGFRLFF
jgi:hypothetical protein